MQPHLTGDGRSDPEVCTLDTRWNLLLQLTGQRTGAEATFQVSGDSQEAAEFLDLFIPGPVPEEKAHEQMAEGAVGKW